MLQSERIRLLQLIPAMEPEARSLVQKALRSLKAAEACLNRNAKVAWKREEKIQELQGVIDAMVR